MAGGVITTGSLPRLLQEGLNRVFGQVYDAHPVEWDKIFEFSTSVKNFEIDQLFEGYGLAERKLEGQDLEYDSAQQGISPIYTHEVWSKGFIATRESMDDELYGVLTKKSRGLAFAMQQTKEVVCADVLNNGFTNTVLMQGGDGQPLYSDAHPLGPSGGTGANTLTTPADLSEASLEALTIIIRNAVDSRGLRIALQPKRLIVPTALCYDAQRILNSVLQNDSANNATNALRDMSAIPDGYAVNNFLDSEDAWFLTTNCPNGLRYIERDKVEFGDDNAFDSDNGKFKARDRYSVGWSDFRGSYASPGSA